MKIAYSSKWNLNYIVTILVSVIDIDRTKFVLDPWILLFDFTFVKVTKQNF